MRKISARKYSHSFGRVRIKLYLMTHWKASNGCEALGQQKRVIERVDELKTEDVRETVSVRKLLRVVFFPLVHTIHGSTSFPGSLKTRLPFSYPMNDDSLYDSYTPYFIINLKNGGCPVCICFHHRSLKLHYFWLLKCHREVVVAPEVLIPAKIMVTVRCERKMISLEIWKIQPTLNLQLC